MINKILFYYRNKIKPYLKSKYFYYKGIKFNILDIIALLWWLLFVFLVLYMMIYYA